MGLLAAGVGHEINNPLTFVIGNLEEIVRQAGAPSARPGVAPSGGVAKLAEEALAGTFRVREIVKELRRFSRAETHAISAVDVHEAIEDAIKLAHNELRFRARLVRQFDLGSPLAMANRTGLSQVVLNLLLNAGHAIGEGHPDANEIRIRTARVGDGVSITVSDTGSGISPEHLGRIFDPFFSTKPESEGQGLGLAICHEIVATAGGNIQVTSALGRGTEFVISLRAGQAPALEGPASTQPGPAATAPPAPRPVSPPGQALVGPGDDRPRALIVDDEDLVRRVLRRQLDGAFRVEDVASAQGARALLATDPAYDLVFCDMMMPGMSGMALADWIAAHAPALRGRLVFMTGGAFTVEAQRYLAQAANPVLEKPFQAVQVLQVARELLARLGTWSGRRREPGAGETTISDDVGAGSDSGADAANAAATARRE
jgi:CheY-like chemotaxis protein